MVTAYTDVGTIVVVLVVMFTIDAFAYYKENGTYAVMAGLLGVFTTGWTFNNGYVVQSAVYNAATAAWVLNKVDANIYVVILSIATIFSFLFVYFERGGVLG